MEDIKLMKDIVEVDVAMITPHEGSHKTDASIAYLKESIKDFGITQPVTIDKNHVVVTGNGVFKAAKELGYKTVPCIILDHLSEEEIVQYRIADDKTQEFASWNEKKLRKELSYLQDPGSMQAYFDENIFNMLGLNAKPKTTVQQQSETAPTNRPFVTEEEKDQRFKDHIRQIDLDMVVKSAEYIEYTCSKCGKDVKVRKW